MVISLKVCGRMILKKARGNLFGLMETVMLALGKTTKFGELVKWILLKKI